MKLYGRLGHDYFADTQRHSLLQGVIEAANSILEYKQYHVASKFHLITFQVLLNSKSIHEQHFLFQIYTIERQTSFMKIFISGI